MKKSLFVKGYCPLCEGCGNDCNVKLERMRDNGL